MKPVAAGRITRPFGKQGEVLAVLYDRFPENYDTREPLHVYIGGLAVPLFISAMERRGKKGELFTFDDIDSEERTALITGLEFFIDPRMADHAAGEGLDELIGYTAVLFEHKEAEPAASGVIVSLEGNDANPLFNILAGDREYLVPASEELVTAIDPDEREIRLSIPPGLLEL